MCRASEPSLALFHAALATSAGDGSRIGMVILAARSQRPTETARTTTTSHGDRLKSRRGRTRSSASLAVPAALATGRAALAIEHRVGLGADRVLERVVELDELRRHVDARTRKVDGHHLFQRGPGTVRHDADA